MKLLDMVASLDWSWTTTLELWPAWCFPWPPRCALGVISGTGVSRGFTITTDIGTITSQSEIEEMRMHLCVLSGGTD